MAKTSPLSAEEDHALMELLWSDEIKHNPLNFAMANYPWGVPGTPLESMKGPRGWQKETLQAIAQAIKDNQAADVLGTAMKVFKDAVASGRGIGKSAEIGMIVNWFQSCILGSSAVITANTESQLKTKTMPEIRKWFALGLNAHWWLLEGMRISPDLWFADALANELKIDPAYYYTQAVMWSEENPDAFAGLHNMNGVLVVFDEASGVPLPIWTVSEGFFTEPTLYRYWLVRSNPRRPTGAFADCFTNADTHLSWRTRSIDGRTVEGIDQAVYDSIIARYGPDSDEARVEVYGQFPKVGQAQLIPRDEVLRAQARPCPPDPGSPLIMAVDVARFGMDKSVIRWRRGRDARSIPSSTFAKLRITELADEVVKLVNLHDPDHIVVDGNGVGGGLVDVLKDVHKLRVVEYNSSHKADETERFNNKRSETWHRMADWIPIAAIDASPTLERDLPSIEYAYMANSQVKKITSKEDLREQLGFSPDDGDALAMTFCQNFARLDRKASRVRRRPVTQYNPLTYR